MSFQIKRAARTGVKMLVGFYSESGCGKTYSALLLARGLAGQKGIVTMIDTESGRGSLYADDAAIGGYQVLELDQPFSPARYIEAIDAAEEAGATVIIIDSMSHEWEGIGGVIDMAGENEARGGKNLNNWNKPKMEHAKMLGRILRSKCHVICCIRAKYKTRQKNDPTTGKKIVVKDEVTSPIQAEDFIFEMIVHAEILPSHKAVITKAHGDLFALLPKTQEEMFTVQHGANLAKWCLGGKASPATPPTDQKPVATTEQRERMITQLCAKFGLETVMEYAIAKGIIQPNQTLSDWPVAQVPATKPEYTLRESSIQTWKAAQ